MTHPENTPSHPNDLALAELVAWIDGELAEGDAARVAARVAASPALQGEVALLRRAGDLVSQMPSHPASEGFADRVLEAARRESGRASPADGPRAAPKPAGRLLGLPRIRVAVAAAVVLVVASGIALRAGQSGSTLSADDDAIARDLLVLANLDALQAADSEDLVRLADDLDVLDDVAGSPGLGG